MPGESEALPGAAPLPPSISCGGQEVLSLRSSLQQSMSPPVIAVMVGVLVGLIPPAKVCTGTNGCGGRGGRYGS